jgi:transcriptional regulator with XRE-family HTH domain
MTFDIGFQIRKIRESKGFSQENMAMDLNLTQPQYSRRECGKVKFSLEEVKQISILLEVDMNVLLNNEIPITIPKKEPLNFNRERDMERLIVLLMEVLVNGEENINSRNNLIENLSRKLKTL